MIDSNTIRQAAQRRNAARMARAPDGWDVIMGCGHRHRFTDEQMHNPLQKTFMADLYYCPKCANGDRTGTGEEGFCTRTVAHEIKMATPLFSGYSKQRATQQQPPVEEQEQT